MIQLIIGVFVLSFLAAFALCALIMGLCAAAKRGDECSARHLDRRLAEISYTSDDLEMLRECGMSFGHKQ